METQSIKSFKLHRVLLPLLASSLVLGACSLESARASLEGTVRKVEPDGTVLEAKGKIEAEWEPGEDAEEEADNQEKTQTLIDHFSNSSRFISPYYVDIEEGSATIYFGGVGPASLISLEVNRLQNLATSAGFSGSIDFPDDLEIPTYEP